MRLQVKLDTWLMLSKRFLDETDPTQPDITFASWLKQEYNVDHLIWDSQTHSMSFGFLNEDNQLMFWMKME